MRLFGTLIIAGLLALSVGASAADHPRLLSQYTHQKWSEESDPPLPVFGVAQDQSGFIWLAASQNLYRFDGLGFEKILTPGGSDTHGSPLVLFAARNGDVWTYFERSERFAVYRNGALQLVEAPPTGGQVTQMVQTADGAIWAGVANIGRGLLRFQNGSWRRFGPENGLPRDQLFGLVAAQDGALWVSYLNSVLRLPPGATQFQTVQSIAEANGRIAQDPAGRIWLTDRSGTRPLTGPGGRGAAAPVRHPYRSDDALLPGRTLFDREGNLWIATRSQGVERIAAPQPGGAASPEAARTAVERIGRSEGLTSRGANRIFEDREGNIWVVGEEGIDKFRPASLRIEPSLANPATYGDVLLAASDGAVYIAQADAVYRVPPGGRPTLILRNPSEPEALCEAPDGGVWIAFSDRLMVWRDGRSRTIPGKPKTETGFYDCAFDRRGDFWATAAGGGFYRFSQGRWETPYGPPDEQTFHPTTLVRDATGRLVVHWSPQTLSWIDGDNRSSTQIEYAGQRPILRTLYPLADGAVLATGTFGLSRFTQGQPAQTLKVTQIPRLRGVNGIVRTSDGQTWMANATTLFALSDADLARAFRDPGFSPGGVTLSFDDGLPKRVNGQSWRPLVRGGDGRLWLTTTAGVVWLDPEAILKNDRPPGLVVTTLIADGVSHPLPHVLKLPAAVADIQINFSALSFANPKANQVRYRLEGYDRAWVDPGLRRQAFYTGLPPGRYRFHVIAANDDGVWNRSGAAVVFVIPPTFLQSRWFLALCLSAGLLGLWCLYRLRVAQIASRIRARLEERVGERERIARELHDTLLQSVQGLILRFQAIAERMPAGAPPKTQLEAALSRADEVMIEGRNRVLDLRGLERSSDLRGIIADLVAAVAFDPPIPVKIVVEGKARPVQPLVASEIVRIVREALFNITRHAQAKSIEIAISFDRQRLGLRIRDDGVGIPEDVLSKGYKEGHFGLIGMRERAERIGGALLVESQVGKGADVTMVFPANLAFELEVSDQPGWRSSLHLFRRGA